MLRGSCFSNSIYRSLPPSEPLFGETAVKVKGQHLSDQEMLRQLRGEKSVYLTDWQELAGWLADCERLACKGIDQRAIRQSKQKARFQLLLRTLSFFKCMMLCGVECFTRGLYTYLRTSITEEINHFSLVRVDSYLIYTADESLLCRWLQILIWLL